MKNCPQCQHPNDDNAKFCNNCGMPLPFQTTQNNQQAYQQQYQQPNQNNNQNLQEQYIRDFYIREEERKQNKKGIGCLAVIVIFIVLVSISGFFAESSSDTDTDTTQEQTTETTTSASQYKESCQTYTYEEIARNPEKYKGENAKFTGEVIQVIESGSSVTLRVNITAEENQYAESGYTYSDTIYVTYERQSDDEPRILEDDIITIYGTLEGLETYSSIFGQSISLPAVEAKYIEIQ